MRPMEPQPWIEALVPDAEGTAAAARALARLLQPGDVLCLAGDLGAGKTTFVAALAAELGAEDEIVSPTFTLENRHVLTPTAAGGPQWLVHYDLYRPGEDARRDLLGAMVEAREEGAILAIEWPAPVKDWLTPYLDLRIGLEPESPQARFLRVRTVPAGWPRRDALVQAWATWAP